MANSYERATISGHQQCNQQGRRVQTMNTTAEQINQLVSEYTFPLEVLQDVNRRLADCNNPHYAQQQLRYLQNIVRAGRAVKREGR